MFFVFGKCPFLLRWKNVLSGSHAFHLRFIRNKSVTRTVISVNRPFIIRVWSTKNYNTSSRRYIDSVLRPVALSSLRQNQKRATL